MYKAIIIDDEEMARTLLKEMIMAYVPDQVSVIDSCKDLAEGVKSIRKNQPDIVFLDIEMPRHSGLELLEFFNEDEITFSIIFVTAYDKYAIQAFKLSAIDYLLKPVEGEDIIKALELLKKGNNTNSYGVLKNNLNNDKPKKIGLNTLTSVSFVEMDDILFLEAEGAYTKVVLKEGKDIIVSKGLKSFENMLSEIPDFIRCHKSYIVNIRYITNYVKSDGGYLVVDKTHEIAISPEKLDLVLKKTGYFL